MPSYWKFVHDLGGDQLNDARDLSDFRDFIRGRRAALYGFMEQGAALELDGDVLRIIPSKDIFIRHLKDSRAVIEDLATQFYSRAIEVVVQCGPTSVATGNGKRTPAQISASAPEPALSNGHQNNGNGGGHTPAPHQTAGHNGNGDSPGPLIEWRATIGRMADRLLRDPEGIYQSEARPAIEMLAPLARDLTYGAGVLGLRRPSELTPIEAEEEVERLARIFLEDWAGGIDLDSNLPATQNGNGVPVRPAREVIVCEDYDIAIAANEEYLKRRPIIDRLFYSQSIALFVGGKHHGKSTAARTSGMCVMRGVPFLGRAVQQGPVLYCASGDEVPVARMELLRMGWNARKDPLQLVHIKPDIDDLDEVLGQIGNLALKYGAIYIVVDMLFDFAPIRDEMSYAGTRAAIGKIQALADRTLASVAATHHSPKYLADAATAGQAALGSQGIAARFSPIVLSRKWAEGLYSISSTTTRDPRGAALIETCIEIDALGWTQSAGEFKSWMKWKVYASRVIALLEGDDRGKEWSVDAVARGLDISRPDAQNALFRLEKDEQLERKKSGRGYRYWLPYQNEQASKATDEMFGSKPPGESHE